MYTKEQASRVRQQFWTTFGRYMKPVAGAGGLPVNWLNYKTGVRHLQFKMDAGWEHATIGIELRHPDESERLHCYQQFESLRSILEQSTNFQWLWQPSVQDENGYIISRISQQLNRVNVLRETDWPAIIAFLKPRIISLDAFWELVKDGF